MTTDVASVPEATGLPAWSSVLAVVAHPDDESFGLGAVLDAFGRAGSTVTVLCFTAGEASTLHGVAGDLRALRAAELQGAAAALGVSTALLRDYPDGALSSVARPTLVEDVVQAARTSGATGLLVFDPSGVTGHPDHAAATAAALEAAAVLELPVLGWTVPRAVADQLNDEFGTGFVGHEAVTDDLILSVDRTRQRIASLAHGSQAVPTSVLWRRLELLRDVEHLRWLRGGASSQTAAGEGKPSTQRAPAPELGTMRVEYGGGDRFEVGIRDHVVTVDQPTEIGGDDLGPTPTELFVAGLASCVAFYARRYLRRHKLDATGLVVQTSYRLGTKPARVSDVDISIELPTELPEQRRDGLLAVASHCTVHNSLTTPPEIRIALT